MAQKKVLRSHIIFTGFILLLLLQTAASYCTMQISNVRQSGDGCIIDRNEFSSIRRLDQISAAIPNDWRIILAVVLSLLSSLSSGLTLGLMTLDVVQLEAMSDGGLTGDAKLQRESAMAKRVLAIRRDGNLVLVSLLLLNVSVNSAFSILSSELTSGLVGLLVSAAVITVFGEILPQAVCAKYGLQAGYYLYPVVVVTECALYVVAKPTALLLDKILGRDIGTAYSKEQLKALVAHHEKALKVLRHEEMQIVSGGLCVAGKQVREAMRPIAFVFGLDVNSTLNLETATQIYLSGYSRVPVFDWDRPDCIVGVFHAKDIVLIDVNEGLPLSSVMALYGRCTYAVDMDMSLLDLLREFKTGRSHLAVVREAVQGDGSTDPFYRHVGIITLEDIVEEIIQDEIYDEYEQKAPARTSSRISSCPGRSVNGRVQRNNVTRLPLDDGKSVAAVDKQSDATRSLETPRSPLPAVSLTLVPDEKPPKTIAHVKPTVIPLQIPRASLLNPSALSTGMRSCASPSYNESLSEAPSSRQMNESGLNKRSGGRDAAAGRLRLLSRRQTGSSLTANEAQAVAMFLAHSLQSLQLPYLTPSALAKLIAEAQVISPPPKTAIVERGVTCDRLALILQGKMKLMVGGSEALECSLGPWSVLASPVLGPVDWKAFKLPPAGATGEAVEAMVGKQLREALGDPFIPEYTATVVGEARPVNSPAFTPVRLLMISRENYIKAATGALSGFLREQARVMQLAHKSAATTAGAGTSATFDDDALL